MADEVVASPSEEPGPAVPSPDQPAAEATPEQEPQKASTLRPIPPRPDRPKLPGVMTKDDDDDIFSTGERDEKGRFKTRGQREKEFEDEIDGVTETPAAKPALPPGTPEPPKGKFKFAGKDFESPEQAEQAHKSLQGMFKPLQERVTKTEEERDYGYRAAAAWEAKARTAEEELARVKAGGAGRSGTSASGGSPDPSGDGQLSVGQLLEDIDTDAFETIAVQGGLPAAGQYLVQETLRVVLEKILPSLQGQTAKELAPYREEQAFNQMRVQTDQLIHTVSELRDQGGNYAFPELRDHNLIREVGEAWKQSGLPADLVFTREGLINAIANYRLLKSFNPAGTAVTPPRAATTRPAPAAAAIPSGEPGGTGPNPNRDRGIDPAVQRLLNALDRAGSPDPDLGFIRRRA